MRWRDLRAGLIVTAILAMLLVGALATRFPEAEIIERAQDWPLLGPLARQLRSRYHVGAGAPEERAELGAEPPSAAAVQGSAEPEVIVLGDPDLLGVKPKVWAPAGTPIYARRDSSGPVLGRLERLFPLSRLRRDGDWFEVRLGNAYSGFSKGWVHLESYTEPGAEELAAPGPVLPLASTAAAPSTISVAREELRGAASESGCGPYGLWTDVEKTSILVVCQQVGAAVDAAYRRRYGLEPVSEPRETIFLFRDTAAYGRFRDRLAPDAHEIAHAYPAMGYLALALDGRSSKALAAVLTHELTHLLNRRSLGPALPPWLDEGMARDLADHGVTPLEGEGRVLRRGLPRLPGQDPTPQLDELMGLDTEAFQEQAQRNYHAAAMWIGYFLESGKMGLRDGFLGFLGDVAAGERLTSELLLGRLGRSWEELEAGFAEWQLDWMPSRASTG